MAGSTSIKDRKNGNSFFLLQESWHDSATQDFSALKWDYLSSVQAKQTEHNWLKFFLEDHSYSLNPNWHEGGHFYSHVLFGLDFVSWILVQTFQSFGRWKLTSIRLIWHPVKLSELLGGAKEEHFSCFPSSGQWEISLPFSN